MHGRVAIVHDWLMSMRGSERFVEVLCGLYPQADLFTLTWAPEQLSEALVQRRVVTSPIHGVARAPFARGRFRALLPLFPLAVESFRLDRYDLIISSSHCVALGAVAPPEALHVAYVHSTLRYAREALPIYERSVPGGSLGRALFRGTARYLRWWETTAAARPHLLVANSDYTRDRIRRYYRRDAAVIEPPVDTVRFRQAAARLGPSGTDAPFLLVSALVPNKRIDVALEAFRGRPERLVVVGEGAERARLERIAPPNVTLRPRVSDSELETLYADCQALLHTAVDDFGMVMVEALAAGKPVLACAEGGALEIVRDGTTGLLIDSPTAHGVRTALDRFARLRSRFDPSALQRHAERFDRRQFERRFERAVEQARRERERPHPRASDGPIRNGSARAMGKEHASRHVEHSNGHAAPSNGHAGHANGHAERANGHAHHSNGHTRSAERNGARVVANGFGAAVLKREGSAPEPDAYAALRKVAAGSHGQRVVKRVIDVALAGAGLALSAPLLVALGVAIRLDSPGPALFYQRRPGLNGRPFTLIKLRTMEEGGRVTRIGRILRPTGLDELPQLWNVMKGEMSIIGPRPEVLARAQRFEIALPGYRARHLVRPGITGWAQVNGMRGDVAPINKRLEFDIEYLRQRSLALDGRILLRTLSTVWSDTVHEFRG